MLKFRLTQVFNCFIQRVTNALNEGINSELEAIKNAAQAQEYQGNTERFQIMIAPGDQDS